MADKLLAEWFWTDRWMGSSAFLLPMEARGVYREMLTQAWRRGAKLPNNHEAIRRAIGCTSKEWKRSWPKVERYWRVDGEGLINDTQVAVYLEAKAAQDRASERGRRGAQARAQAQLKRVLKDKPPSPSPSPNEQLSRQETSLPADLPPADRAERAIRASTNGLRSKLLALVDRAVREDPRGRDPTELIRLFTAYRKPDGTDVRGVVNPALLTHERLERSVADAEAQLEDWRRQRGA